MDRIGPNGGQSIRPFGGLIPKGNFREIRPYQYARGMILTFGVLEPPGGALLMMGEATLMFNPDPHPDLKVVPGMVDLINQWCAANFAGDKAKAIISELPASIVDAVLKKPHER